MCTYRTPHNTNKLYIEVVSGFIVFEKCLLEEIKMEQIRLVSYVMLFVINRQTVDFIESCVGCMQNISQISSSNY